MSNFPPPIKGEICPHCDGTIPSQCGTESKANMHRKRGEPLDEACQYAWNRIAKRRMRNTRRRDAIAAAVEARELSND